MGGEEIVVESLWDSLHDARLTAVKWDPQKGAVELRLTSHHLKSFHHLPDDLEFLVRLDGLLETRVVRYTESEQAVEWQEFVGAFDDDWMDVSEADLVESAPGTVTLRLGVTDDSIYHEALLRGERLSVGRSDGEPLSMEMLLRLGREYWDVSAARRSR